MLKPDQSEIAILIASYLEGNYTPDEEKTLIEWVESSDSNRQYYDELRNIWEASARRDKHKVNPEEAWAKVSARAFEASTGNIFWNYWKKAAAILILPLIIGNLIWFYIHSVNASSDQELAYNETFAAYGSRTAIRLDDGSQVWLNSGSSLKYPGKFRGKERTVYLTGEAFFEVANNRNIPFIVKTNTLIVRATGTVFNVSDHISDPGCEVTLVTGKVFVNGSIDSKSDKAEYTEMFPGQHMVYNKETRSITLRNEDVNEYISWKDGKLIFRNKPLSYVVNKISQTFNVEIELRGSVLQDYRYRATFEDESLTEILKLLKISSPIDYLEVKRDSLPDGSFPKRKVIIFPREKAGLHKNTR